VTKSRRRSSRTRKTSASRTVPRRSGTRVVKLKPLYQEIGRAVDQLQKLPPSDRVKFVIERLSQCRAEFEQFCGPTMDIPGEALPSA
jgi:hypothetical protein